MVTLHCQSVVSSCYINDSERISTIFTSIFHCIYLVFFNSCRRLPETKRHSSLFLHLSGSKFLVVMATCTPSIHVFLGRPLSLLSRGIHSIINSVILSSGILLTWPYHCRLFLSMLSMMSGFPFTPIISFICSFYILHILHFLANLLSTFISVDNNFIYFSDRDLPYFCTVHQNALNYPLSYGVPVRERYGSTLLPAKREQHDQNCTQSH